MGTGVSNTRFPLLCTGYSVKLIFFLLYYNNKSKRLRRFMSTKLDNCSQNKNINMTIVDSNEIKILFSFFELHNVRPQTGGQRQLSVETQRL